LAFTFVAGAYTAIMLKENRSMNGRKQAGPKENAGKNILHVAYNSFIQQNKNNKTIWFLTFFTV